AATAPSSETMDGKPQGAWGAHRRDLDPEVEVGCGPGDLLRSSYALPSDLGAEAPAESWSWMPLGLGLMLVDMLQNLMRCCRKADIQDQMTDDKLV
ncbi:unnamed protein product, partial [Polarella glacialis]